MSMFSDNELAFLHEGVKRVGAARVASLGPAGDPWVAPTRWTYNPEHGSIDIRGLALTPTRTYEDVARTGRAAVVIDDAGPKWPARAVLLTGCGSLHLDLIRIHPERIMSFGIEGSHHSSIVAADEGGRSQTLPARTGGRRP